MPCGYACFAYLSHVFALNASVAANAEAGTFPQRDSNIIRTTVAPTVGLSMRSARTRLGFGYSPSFSYIKDFAEPTQQGFANQSSVNFSQRVSGAFRHQISPQTNALVNAAFVTGSFDSIGLRQQLATTVNAGTPVTQGNFRSVVGTGALDHAISRRLSLGVAAETFLTETQAKQNTLTPEQQSVNAALLGNQFRAGIGITPSYLLTSRLRLLLTGGTMYQYVNQQRLLSLSAVGGTSLAFSRVTSGGVSLGLVHTGAFPGEHVPRRFTALNALAGASLTRQLSEGRNAVGFTAQLAWAPGYDPVVDRIRSRVLLNASLNWKPARDWSIQGTFQGSTATDAPPKEGTLFLNGELQPFPDTRLSFGIPVTYTINTWSQLLFGVRANLPSPNLAQRYKLIDPDYSGFVGVSLSPLADRR